MKISPMRIKLILTHASDHIIDWPKDIHSFPKSIRAYGRIYEAMAYDKVDEFGILYEYHFSEISKHGSSYPWETPVDLDVLKYSDDAYYGCQCGAKYTSFPQIHMFFCRKWKPRD